MSTIVSTIQEIVRQELRSLRTAELGVVEAIRPHSSSSDKGNYGCDVRLRNSGLLLKRVPVATGHIGTAAIPNVGDLVLLVFDKGNVNQPLIVGRLYNDEDRAPLGGADEVVFRLPLAEADDKTVKAAIRNHQDKSSPREAILEMPPKITVRIADGMVQAVAGKTEMKLEQPDGVGGTVTISAGRTRIVVNQDGDITMEAAGSMTLKAAGQLSLEGRSVSVKGQMSAKVEAGLQATMQGTSVVIKGMTSFSQ